MGTNDPAERLRGRAEELRRFARRLESTRVTTVCAFAGDDTWLGATAAECASDLRHIRLTLLTRCDDLRASARRLERAADALAATEPIGGR